MGMLNDFRERRNALLDRFKTDDSRHDVVLNILDLTAASMRGRNAGSWWEILVYRVHSIVIGLLGGSAGATITAALNHPNFTEGYWWGGLSIAAAVAVQLYKTFNIETNATQALKARDAFSQIDENSAAALRQMEPKDTMAELNKNANTLLSTFHGVMPELTNALEGKALERAEFFVNNYGDRWKQKPSAGGRRMP
jgi:hypothetical protein